MGHGDLSAIDDAGFTEGCVDKVSSTPGPDVSAPDTDEREILQKTEVDDPAVDG